MLTDADGSVLIAAVESFLEENELIVGSGIFSEPFFIAQRGIKHFMDFKDFNLNPAVAAGIAAAGYKTPTPIQSEAIPTVMSGLDLMGLAQTGTGKTAAFVLPILHALMQGSRNRPRALIISPTRELAEQTHQAIEVLGRNTRLHSVTVYGGVSINTQITKLRRGPEIIVACPGRLLDHVGRRTVDLSNVDFLVIDEADQMFDMGFLPDIRRILQQVPKKRQTMLFSATMSTEIKRLAQDVLVKPVTVKVGDTAPADTVSHALYPVSPNLKTPLLLELLRHSDMGSVLVFTRTKHRAKRLGEALARAGHRSTSIQGNLSQSQRQVAMDGFRSGRYRILVATDIAARGIDVNGISHVINYDIPATPEAYIHRIGRTGRATCTGDAFTLVTSEDASMVRAISKILDYQIERRTLPGFDYKASVRDDDVPPIPQARKPYSPSSRKPAFAAAERTFQPRAEHVFQQKSERPSQPRAERPSQQNRFSAGEPGRRKPVRQHAGRDFMQKY